MSIVFFSSYFAISLFGCPNFDKQFDYLQSVKKQVVFWQVFKSNYEHEKEANCALELSLLKRTKNIACKGGQLELRAMHSLWQILQNNLRIIKDEGKF